MKLKKWPYWLRGGLVGVIISIVLITIGSRDSVSFTSIPTGMGLSPILSILLLVIGVAIPLIVVFIIGALIGALYGKIFGKREVTNVTIPSADPMQVNETNNQSTVNTHPVKKFRIFTFVLVCSLIFLPIILIILAGLLRMGTTLEAFSSVYKSVVIKILLSFFLPILLLAFLIDIIKALKVGKLVKILLGIVAVFMVSILIGVVSQKNILFGVSYQANGMEQIKGKDIFVYNNKITWSEPNFVWPYKVSTSKVFKGWKLYDLESPNDPIIEDYANPIAKSKSELPVLKDYPGKGMKEFSRIIAVNPYDTNYFAVKSCIEKNYVNGEGIPTCSKIIISLSDGSTLTKIFEIKDGDPKIGWDNSHIYIFDGISYGDRTLPTQSIYDSSESYIKENIDKSILYSLKIDAKGNGTIDAYKLPPTIDTISLFKPPFIPSIRLSGNLYGIPNDLQISVTDSNGKKTMLNTSEVETDYKVIGDKLTGSPDSITVPLGDLSKGLYSVTVVINGTISNSVNFTVDW